MSLLIACLLAAGLSGCLDESSSGDGADDGGDDGMEAAVAKPDDFEDSQMVSGGLDPLNSVDGQICQTPPDPCIRYPFTVAPGNSSFQMTAVLTWGIDANDFDLYLYKGGEESTSAGDPPPETEERITATVGPGDYEVIVVPWSVASDTFTLSVTFT